MRLTVWEGERLGGGDAKRPAELTKRLSSSQGKVLNNVPRGSSCGDFVARGAKV